MTLPLTLTLTLGGALNVRGGILTATDTTFVACTLLQLLTLAPALAPALALTLTLILILTLTLTLSRSVWRAVRSTSTRA